MKMNWFPSPCEDIMYLKDGSAVVTRSEFSSPYGDMAYICRCAYATSKDVFPSPGVDVTHQTSAQTAGRI